jgi:hypothetical protein
MRAAIAFERCMAVTHCSRASHVARCSHALHLNRTSHCNCTLQSHARVARVHASPSHALTFASAARRTRQSQRRTPQVTHESPHTAEAEAETPDARVLCCYVTPPSNPPKSVQTLGLASVARRAALLRLGCNCASAVAVAGLFGIGGWSRCCSAGCALGGAEPRRFAGTACAVEEGDVLPPYPPCDVGAPGVLVVGRIALTACLPER